MPLAYKPHALAWEPLEQRYQDMVRLAPEWNGTALAFRGQLTPISSVQMFEKFGIEVERSALMLCDVESARNMQENDRIWFGDRRFAIKALPQFWEAIARISCAEVALSELDHA